ncbi:Phosphoglucomutase, chloroplastic -like protein [Gossypium arboreum]|uniref:phosphoglucomutase (alpha-D-glucose-1,6-bisphosphate-dependent) n=1 Tax=Gossypium arboreum TaxID=29729 RepID=A0A0B0PA16_GOSAR|nr:Phosphoglucomutase, chloroplastic -like protein [Gossypium arboreum]
MASCCNSLRLEGFFSSAFKSSKRSSNAIPIPSSSFSHLCNHRFPLKSISFSVSRSPSFTIKASSSSSSSSTTIAEPEGIKITSVPTKPIEGQKTGTSGLRKKVKVFMEENYLSNWIQSLFNSLPPEDYKNGVLVLGGDGRYFNREASQTIIKIAAGNGVGKILVGRCVFFHWHRHCLSFRGRYSVYTSRFCCHSKEEGKHANGGFIMSASHNPGGPEYDWGIKFNYNSGQPAPESITDKIYGNTLSISEIKMAEIPDVDLSRLGGTKYGNFTVEVIDPVSDYLELMESVFDFQMIKNLLSRSDFSFAFDAMHAVTGAYAKPIFVDKLGARPDSISNGVPLEDFGHGHPDPNLTYAKDLVNIMYSENGPDFGAASDGDGDRNMILGKKFFVTPSDSVAIIAANAQAAIPYFRSGPKGLARSMPTSGALDRVAEKLGLTFFEVPTGWKFFGNLMDAGKLSICGEESFGTGSDHIREKDGIWAVLAWLSIIAYRNKDKKPGEKLVSISDVVKEHWATYGRNFFSRYDYEECESEGANKMIEYLRGLISKSKAGEKYGNYVLQFADDFSYTDPVSGWKCGLKAGCSICFHRWFKDYIPFIYLALSVSKLKDFTGREKPTVIT